MIHVLVVHDVPLIGALLLQVLTDQPDMRVCRCAASHAEALAYLQVEAVDVVLVDVRSHLDGVSFIRHIARRFAQVKIVLFGLMVSRTAILPWLEIGATGYICQDDSLDDLIRSVRYAVQGEAQLSPQVAAGVIARLAQLNGLATELNGYHESSLQEQRAKLTLREREILDLVGSDHTNQEIAERLIITVGTVKNHVHNLLEKLNIATRRQLAIVARQLAARGAAINEGTIDPAIQRREEWPWRGERARLERTRDGNE